MWTSQQWTNITVVFTAALAHIVLTPVEAADTAKYNANMGTILAIFKNLLLFLSAKLKDGLVLISCYKWWPLC